MDEYIEDLYNYINGNDDDRVCVIYAIQRDVFL